MNRGRRQRLWLGVFDGAVGGESGEVRGERKEVAEIGMSEIENKRNWSGEGRVTGKCARWVGDEKKRRVRKEDGCGCTI